MSSQTKHVIEVIVTVIVSVLVGLGLDITIIRPNTTETETITETVVIEPALELSTEHIPAVLDGDLGEFIEGAGVQTVEEVDGGPFEDIVDGVSVYDDLYADLGWAETYGTSSPQAFANATLGKCIIANNVYGAQCVSLVRVFWWSYANRDVSTCGTGMAKGMMLCADENAGEDFEVIGPDDLEKVIAGTTMVYDGGQYGHTCIALGPVVNGYVACLGENQGGTKCFGENGQLIGGAATNIINLSVKNFIGGYIPKSYIPVPLTPDTGVAK